MSISVNTKIGFFSLVPTGENESGFVGAILITDPQGTPLEFKCAEVVRPTEIQRVLYGRKMKPHIAVQLCGVPLLKAVSITPEILFVNDAAHLEIRLSVAVPVLCIIQGGMTVSAHETFPADKNIINDIQISFDMSEPFNRIKTAVEVLGKQDKRFA
ncbi:MAG: hypothetical protein LBH00_01320 [Planctomycetaceae bacterium]|jgi:hypothetical protein|nr:hypothetical protein [Planctomycetaceae bacterium]